MLKVRFAEMQRSVSKNPSSSLAIGNSRHGKVGGRYWRGCPGTPEQPPDRARDNLNGGWPGFYGSSNSASSRRRWNQGRSAPRTQPDRLLRARGEVPAVATIPVGWTANRHRIQALRRRVELHPGVVDGDIINLTTPPSARSTSTVA
jgi:hypothetical protein